MQAQSDIDQRQQSLVRKQRELAAHEAAKPNMNEALDVSAACNLKTQAADHRAYRML